MDTNTGKRRLSQAHPQQNLQRNSEPEHTFNQLYNDLQKASQAQLGWQWLLPLRSADAHHLQQILQIPDTDQQSDFGDLVLSLTEILINSLNEKSLKKLIPFEKREAFKDKKGVALLETVLHVNHLDGADAHIVFLRKLQGLCSSGSEHRKGCNSLEVAKHFGFGNQSLQNVFANILNSASDTLNYFIILVNSGRIREIFEKNQIAMGYAAFSDLIGIADFGTTDASANHDEVIYELQSKP